MPVIHFEYTQFYYPGDMEFPGEETVFSAKLLLMKTCLTGSDYKSGSQNLY